MLTRDTTVVYHGQLNLMTYQMPKRCVKVWYNILKHAVGNLSGPKHHPLSSGKGIHSDMSYTIIIEQPHNILNNIIIITVHTSSALIEIHEVLDPKLGVHLQVHGSNKYLFWCAESSLSNFFVKK